MNVTFPAPPRGQVVSADAALGDAESGWRFRIGRASLRQSRVPHDRLISVRGPGLGKVSLPVFTSEETNGSGLLFLAGGLFGSDGLLFILRCGVGFGLVLAGFLLVGLRGTVAHNFVFCSAG